MSGIIEPAVDAYILSLVPERDTVLREMEEAARRDRVPIIGPAVGTLLAQMARAIHAQRVFELGSAIGYSTIWLARAVGPDGKVYYTDSNETNAKAATGYFERAGVRDRIEVLVGDALECFDGIPGDFDMIFNDVDKEGYPAVYRNAASRVRAGGWLVTDNTLWSGRAADPSVNDADTRGVKEFNRLIAADARFVTSLLPLRDGVSLALRLA